MYQINVQKGVCMQITWENLKVSSVGNYISRCKKNADIALCSHPIYFTGYIFLLYLDVYYNRVRRSPRLACACLAGRALHRSYSVRVLVTESRISQDRDLTHALSSYLNDGTELLSNLFQLTENCCTCLICGDKYAIWLHCWTIYTDDSRWT
jgi:hypothetical protein